MRIMVIITNNAMILKVVGLNMDLSGAIITKIIASTAITIMRFKINDAVFIMYTPSKTYFTISILQLVAKKIH